MVEVVKNTSCIPPVRSITFLILNCKSCSLNMLPCMPIPCIFFHFTVLARKSFTFIHRPSLALNRY